LSSSWRIGGLAAVLATGALAATGAIAPPASAATASVEGSVVRIAAATGEANALSITSESTTSVQVVDTATPLSPGPGCTPTDAGITCATPANATIDISAGDQDDSITTLTSMLSFIDAGTGADVITTRNGVSDSVWCGDGLDTVTPEVLDFLDTGCESVDYGPPGIVGRTRAQTGRGRLVRVPGQTWARVDRRILPDVLYLVRRYRVRIEEGYGTVGHTHYGEHPLGLAVDILPGAGSTWADVSRLARWAEPRQNHPRFPFRWVGWNGDVNHGHPSVCKPRRGCYPHLHLSWSHSPTAPRHIARTVWAFEVL
jgi:hypothetical protein